MLLAPGQPIPHGRPYRYHLNGPVHMMTARKRVRPLPTHRLAERHSADHSSSDSSSEASSDFHSDASSDSSSRHPLSDHSSLDLPGTFEGLSRKRRRSPMTSVPALSPVSGALSTCPYCCTADLIHRLRSLRISVILAEVEVDHRETSLRDDDIVRVSDEPHLEQDIDPMRIWQMIDVWFCLSDALRDRGIDARVIVEAVDRDDTETFEELVNQRSSLKKWRLEKPQGTLEPLNVRMWMNKSETEEMKWRKMEKDGMEENGNWNRNGNPWHELWRVSCQWRLESALSKKSEVQAT
ncbi:hypothetical protein Tco_0534240 [Tanacetum coccineum]